MYRIQNNAEEMHTIVLSRDRIHALVEFQMDICLK